jgi:hypothetical protein
MKFFLPRSYLSNGWRKYIKKLFLHPTYLPKLALMKVYAIEFDIIN